MEYIYIINEHNYRLKTDLKLKELRAVESLTTGFSMSAEDVHVLLNILLIPIDRETVSADDVEEITESQLEKILFDFFQFKKKSKMDYLASLQS